MRQISYSFFCPLMSENTLQHDNLGQKKSNVHLITFTEVEPFSNI